MESSVTLGIQLASLYITGLSYFKLQHVYNIQLYAYLCFYSSLHADLYILLPECQQNSRPTMCVTYGTKQRLLY